MGKTWIWLISACSLVAWAESAPPSGAPARMVVIIGHHYGHEPPVLTKDDLIVEDQHELLAITNFVPLRGDRAALELFLLVDNCSNCEPGSKFEELRKFIASQPSTTTVGVAYIKDGALEPAVSPTQDRERVIQALSPPAGSKPANPFVALTDLIKGWKPDGCRHAVLMISNGIDPAPGNQLQNPSAEAAIQAAQKAGVTVFAIYHPSADYTTADYSKIYSGQVLLAHVAMETGGEAYFLGFGPLPSLAPFLSDMADHFANQYLLEFLARPVDAPGAFQTVTVRSKNQDLELMVPGQVWVAGTAGTDKKLIPSPAKRR